jgi:flagellar biosynthetic protein FliR
VAFTLNFPWIEAVMLASVRMTTFLAIAPPFSTNAFPLRVKAMLGIGLALAVSPRVASGYVSPDTAGFIIGLLVELVTGALLGFLVLIVFSAIQSAGNLIDLFGGFQLAQGFDPQMGINGAQFSRLYQMTALALLFASGGYQLTVGQMLLSAVQIAGPLIIVLFLADVGLGLLTRVAPALNAFALGFPLKILITLALAGLVFAALPQIVEAITGQAVSIFTGVK